jgi:alpha,alpha-trehalose-phosphate synthase [UDP-forming]
MALIRRDLPESLSSRRIILISNRPPYTTKKRKGKRELHRGTGGLVTALDPVMKKTGGVWFALVRGDQEGFIPSLRIPDEAGEGPGYQIHNLKVSAAMEKGFYQGFSNRTLWPLFHCFLGKASFEEETWRTYLHVNWSVYKSIIRQIRENDLVWIHDYHFIPLPKLLRRSTKKFGIGYFLHIPFPPLDIFRAMPWAEEVLEGILGSDLVGFHTEGYVHNFLDAVEYLLKAEVDRDRGVVSYAGREVKCGAFPISIDYARFKEVALDGKTEHRVNGIRKAFRVKYLGIGVDRLDYTKGLAERLLAVEKFLERYKNMRKNFVFIQLTVPSREKVTEYEEMRRTIEEMVGRINGKFAEGGWVPIHYYYRSLSFENLVAYYRSCDVGVVTPLKDGMNLVAKEYAVSNVGTGGSLILSELAGAADELKEAHLVNPYHIEGMADALYMALTLPENIRQERMSQLNRRVQKGDIYSWLRSFLTGWDRAQV